MSRHRNSIAPQITEEACHWFVLMREPEVSAEDREAFAEWLRASPMHVGAYLEITRLWSDAAQIGQDTKVDLTEDLSNVVPFREGGDRSHLPADDLDTSGSNGKLGAKKRSAKWMPMAASIVGACVMAGGACWLATRPPTYQTDVGEQRVITLEDQSIVRLNSRSKLQVRLLPSLREVRLLEGQALFEVAHDSARPFIVRSGDVAVRAVGTQFDVNRRESGTVVTVVEGRVKVNTVPASPISQFVLPGQTDKRTSSSDQASVFVSAGEQVRVAQAAPWSERRMQTRSLRRAGCSTSSGSTDSRYETYSRNSIATAGRRSF